MIDRRKLIESVFIETPVYDDRNKDVFPDHQIKMKKGKFERTEKINQELEADIYNVIAQGYHKIVIRRNQEIIGMIEAEMNTNAVIPFPKITGIAVRKPHRGRGYSKIMYSWMIDLFGGVISDEKLTGKEGYGSFQLWVWLSTKYPSYMWKSNETAIIPIKGPINPTMMGSKNDHFMSTKEPFDYNTYNKRFAKPFKMPSYSAIEMPKKSGTLTEMPQFSDKDKDLADHEAFGPPENSTFKKSYPLSSKGKIDLYEYNSKVSSKEILLYSPEGECVGVLAFDEPHESFLPYPMVTFSGVKKEHRGKGYSKLLYAFVINMYGGIISDATLTGEEGYGSFQVWQSLGKKYTLYMVNTDTGEVNPLQNISKSSMGRHDERYLATSKPFDFKKHNLSKSPPVNEVELKSPIGGNDIDQSDPNDWDFISGKTLVSKNIGNGIVFLKMKIEHSKDVKYALKDTKTKQIISGMRAQIDQHDYKVEPTEAQISSVVTSPVYRGKGWGKLLYKMVLETEKTIVSDSLLYPGAATIWKSYLPTIANVYNFSESNGLEPFDFAKGTSKDGVNDYFVASTKKML